MTDFSYSVTAEIKNSYQLPIEIALINDYLLLNTINNLQAENAVLIEKVHKLEQVVNFDGLTGLSRREWCFYALNKMIADEAVEQISVVFLDLDNLKAINDMMGHYVGDLVICSFSNMLKKHCPERAVVSRYGGDEFVVLLPNFSLQQAEAWCDILKFQVNENTLNDNAVEKLNVDFSHGVHNVTTCNDCSNIDLGILANELIQKADQAMYRDKRTKKTSDGL
ncbi:GGDEF domain-containing protein [Vibrio sp. SM6]|uniref:diguanylate cyclase n=1 Tax=Vibrio agarilyticus TaxID=2726741 RepID=A0A7X8TU69_9VIBR|nr:GGDEF domain-containing protein [Vibrio agarilyticus]NLS14865.1 GGDEF domain-containing protein [Vibrio agarilyticus]